jgi:hypothetical protein
MNPKKITISLCVAGAIVLAGSIAIAQQAKKGGPAAGDQQEIPLSPGWSEADMQACMAAGTPGKMHEHLARDVGVWHGKTTMWMGPGMEPVASECTTTMSSMMDGRFIKCEVTGEMPGMGPFNGFGIYGFDNVAQKFVSAWVDSCGTGIMNGTGELSPDGKTMTWTYTYTCPITKKPAMMREVDTTTGPDSKTFEMFGADPKSGKEYKMVSIEYTRKP